VATCTSNFLPFESSQYLKQQRDGLDNSEQRSKSLCVSQHGIMLVNKPQSWGDMLVGYLRCDCRLQKYKNNLSLGEGKSPDFRMTIVPQIFSAFNWLDPQRPLITLVSCQVKPRSWASNGMRSG